MTIHDQNFTANIDPHAFPVEMQDIKTAHDIYIPKGLGRAVVRTDTDEVLGIHGQRYELIPHDDVCNAVLDAVDLLGLGNGNVSANIDLSKNGARMRGEFVFDDLVVEPVEGDHVKFRIQFYNSYDGAWSVQIACDALRLWCLNGCTTADAVFRTWQKHTFALNVSAYTKQIADGLDTFWNNKQKWQSLSEKPCDAIDAGWLFRNTLTKVPAKTKAQQEEVVPYNKKQQELLEAQWELYSDELGKNMWATYNAATHWATHTQDYASPMDKTRERENLVAQMQRSSEWKLMAA